MRINRQKSQWHYSALFIFVLGFVIAGCVPNQKTSNSRKSSSSAKSSTTTTKEDAPTASQSSPLYWFTNSVITSEAVTINLNTQNVIYLRGSDIQGFLETKDKNGIYNYNKAYCLVATFDHITYNSAKRQLRARAVPIVFNNFSSSTKERLFRIDLPEATSNQSVCSGTVEAFTETGDATVYADASTSAFAPNQFCSNCTSIIPSKFVSLFVATQVGSNFQIAQENLVPKTELNISKLGMRIDTISGSTSGESLCSISSCQAKGFDCCLDGQCVDDASLKPNASSNPDFNQATADVAVNPLNFINWPNIYYICGLAQPVNTTPSPGPDPTIEANATFERLKQEFFCLEEGKKTTPDFGVGVCTKSTLTSKVICEANGTCSNSSFTTQATCVTAGKIWTPYIWTYHCYPSGDQTAYLNIRSSVWDRCGCSADPLPTSPDDPNCPDFGLKAIYDTAGNITEIACYNPPPELDPLPFQKLDLTVPARSAPHRFYLSQTGEAIDDVAKTNFSTIIPGETPKVEGTEFSYTDPAGKLEPNNNGQFNMNAIIGQMDVNLGQSRPAVKVDVQLDTTYVISTIKGFYNPCPQCARDSWFDAFAPHPPSSQGRGLEPIGHTTFRDNYLTNITLGNYEDTHFGRACYLPPTMIPYGHNNVGTSTIQAQRMARLETQAALFVNGYQKDWFGFNKGALIGSFDGVRWFAIGTGRMVRATSTKLYLAINQPFADLAEPTDLVVSITTDVIGADVAAVHDFDPSLSDNSAYKNTGASCQKYHQCSNDADCVNQLGWEYMCANVSAVKTLLPVFETTGTELKESATVTGFSKILQGGMPSGSGRRCVYRGMGAPCKKDPFTNHIYTNDLTLAPKDYSRIKNFICAPGFWCADLSTNNFNDEIMREPNNLFGILYGMEANVLGRPKNYINANKSLKTSIRDNLHANLKLYSPSSGVADWGLCRPGKSTGTGIFVDQHKNKDTSLRMDYISQISGCNPDLNGTDRVRSCPIFDMNQFESTTSTKVNKAYRNYIFPDSSTSTANDLRRNQNMCGRSAKSSSGVSGFTDIELPGQINTVVQPALVENACLRRAGSICHSSLECSPGPLHKTASERLGLEFFGGNLAEREFWEEDLICGQRDPAPFLTDKDFNTYELKNNLCCREVGKSLTLYTSSNNKATLNSLSTNEFTNAFDSGRLASDNPTIEGRYSRYEIVAPLTSKTSTNKATINGQTSRKERPHFIATQAPQSDYQWRTIHDTGRRTCCGTGFIRKFADGTHDWRIRDRLKLTPTNFACLNMRNDLPLLQDQTDISKTDYFAADSVGSGIGNSQETNYNNDVDFMCFSPFDGNNIQDQVFGSGRGCASIPFAPTEGFKIVAPDNYSEPAGSSVTMSFFPSNNYWKSEGSGTPSQEDIRIKNRMFPEAPFMATPFDYAPGFMSAENIGLSGVRVPWSFLGEGDVQLYGFAFYLPSYITVLDSRVVTSIRIRYFCATGGCKYAFGGSDSVNSSATSTPTHELDRIRRTITGTEIDKMHVCTSEPEFITPPLSPGMPANDNATAGGGSGVITAAGLKALSNDEDGRAQLTGVCQFNDNGRIVIAVTLNSNVEPASPTEGLPWVWAGAEVDFKPANSRNYPYGTARTTDGTKEALKPGNSLYYLTKLGRMELLGIPQISYAPLYCNSNRSRLVPGIFVYGGDTRAEFTTGSGSGVNYTDINGYGHEEFMYDNSSSSTDRSLEASNGASAVRKVVYKDKIDHPEIFSENEFQCCMKLGQTATSDEECCSGFSVPDAADATKRTCKLPRGANLNVYFNRFVSSDGLLEDVPMTETKRIGFKDEHFISETGEIKFTTEAYDTLVELGKRHCRDGTVQQGAAFGNYYGEPNRLFFDGADSGDDLPTADDENLRIFGIVDSPKDFDTTGENPAGYQHFMAGFRWNHHYYCGLPATSP